MLKRICRVLSILVLISNASEALAACTPDPPTDGAAVVCDGTDSTGYDGSGATGLTITTAGAAILDDSNPALDSAILVSDDNTVTIGTDAQINVTEANGFGVRGNNDNFFDNQGTITINAADGRGLSLNENTTGILPNGAVNSSDIFAIGARSIALETGMNSGVATLGLIEVMGDESRGISAADHSDPAIAANITNTGTINVSGNDAFGIKAGDGWIDGSISMGEFTPESAGIRNQSGASINISGARGFGIRGEDDNWADNRGTITIDGDDGRGISLGENTTGISSDGAVNSSDIFVNGIRSIALETGDNTGADNTGLIELMGDESRGISAGDRTNYAATDTPAILNSGMLNVGGADAIGIKAGDGWIDMSNPRGPFGLIVNLNAGVINVSGDRAIGVFAGDETNTSFNNNSFAANGGTINVTGVDSVGVSLGGNDLFDSYEINTPFSTDFDNAGTITGDADAGPLVEFRGFVSGKENRILVRTSAQIIADLTNLGTANRALAIRGSNGNETILNFGEIQGIIEFNDGDDRYIHNQGATLMSGLPGAVRGGDGFDMAELSSGSGALETFDLSVLADFEVVQIGGGTGWALSGGAGFTGLTEIAANGRLQVPTPITLGGDFSMDSTGTIDVTLDSMTPPLTVQGMSTFDGSLVLTAGPSLTPSATPYRVVLANGGYTGQFQVSGTSGINVFTPSYDAAGLLVLFQSGLVAVAQGANQRAIAQNLTDIEAAGGATGDLQALIDSLFTSTGKIPAVYNALSPEVYDVHTTVVVEGGRRVTNLLLDRPRECREGQPDPWKEMATQLPCHASSWSPWVAAVGGFRDREKFSDHPRYDTKMGGLVAGIDVHPMEDLDLTFAISSQRGTLNAAGAGESTVTLTDLSGQAAWSTGRLRTQGVVSWGHGFHRDRRLIRQSQTDYPLNSRGQEEHDSDRITIAAEVGAEFDAGPFEIEPLVGLDWAWVYQRPIHESDAGGFGIRIASRDDDIGSINAGVRLSTIYEQTGYIAKQLEWMDGVWRPTVEVRWRQVLEGDKRDIEARFEGSPDSVSDFTISGEEDDGGVEIGAGISFVPKNANRLQFDLRYDAFVAPQTVAHNLVGRVMIGF